MIVAAGLALLDEPLTVRESAHVVVTISLTSVGSGIKIAVARQIIDVVIVSIGRLPPASAERLTTWHSVHVAGVDMTNHVASAAGVCQVIVSPRLTCKFCYSGVQLPLPAILRRKATPVGQVTAIHRISSDAHASIVSRLGLYYLPQLFPLLCRVKPL